MIIDDNFDEGFDLDDFQDMLNSIESEGFEDIEGAGEVKPINLTPEELKAIEDDLANNPGTKGLSTQGKSASGSGEGSESNSGNGSGGESNGQGGSSGANGRNGKPTSAMIVVDENGISSDDLERLKSMIGEEGAEQVRKQIEEKIKEAKGSKPTEEEIKQMEDLFNFIKSILTDIYNASPQEMANYVSFSLVDFHSKKFVHSGTMLCFDVITEILMYRKNMHNLVQFIEKKVREDGKEKEFLDEMGTAKEVAITKLAEHCVETWWETQIKLKNKKLKKDEIPVDIEQNFRMIDIELNRDR